METLSTWESVSAPAYREGGRNYLPAALANAVYDGELYDPDEIAKGIAEAWTMAEYPLQCLDRDTWLYIFDCAGGFVSDDPDVTERPTEIPNLYRAAAPGHEDGMSWTDDFEMAAWFAGRFDQNPPLPIVVRDDIRPDQVIGRFKNRQESEWVVIL